MSNNKYFKNKNRNVNESYSKYEPQYKIKNIMPEEVTFNPPINKFTSKQPQKTNSNRIPTVGNKQEVWNSQEIEDDLDENDVYEEKKVSSRRAMIDNNDYVTADTIGNTETNIDFSELSKVPEDNYVLIVKGVVLLVGTADEVESEIKRVVDGENPLFHDVELFHDDVLVFKRNKIKIGIFIN